MNHTAAGGRPGRRWAQAILPWRWTPRVRDLWVTLAVRGCGGLVGVLPPLVALAVFDRTQYGAASANVALALLFTGPVNQYVQQGYLRDLLMVRGQAEGARPVGTSIIYLYYLAALMLLAGLVAFGLPPIDAALTGLLTLLTIGARVQETHLVVAGQPKTAVTAFYILPPLLLCGGMVACKHALAVTDFTAVSLAQLAAYGVSLVLSCFSRHAPLADLRPPPLPRGRSAWAEEFRPVRIFFGNGVLLGAAEQAPTLLLRWLGLAAAIPHFEIARKAASVPSLVAHAFGMQLSPRLVNTADGNQWPQFVAVLRIYCVLLVAVSTAYVGGLVAVVMGLGTRVPLFGQVDHKVSAVLLASALITAASAPFGAAVVALRADRWLLLGPGLSLAAQLVVSLAFFKAYGELAIAAAVVAQNALLSAAVVLGTVLNLRRRRRATPR